MIFLKILRVLVTIVLVIALLISGGAVLFNYSVSRVVLDDDYFGEHLLESGTYDDIFEMIMDDPAIQESFSDIEGDAGEIFMSGLAKEMPELLSETAADYLSDWLEYVKGERDIDDIPALDLENAVDDTYDFVIDLTKDDEFMEAMLAQHLTSIGDDIENYDNDEYKEMIADLELEEEFEAIIEEVMEDEETLAMINESKNDPLAFFRDENTSDEEMIENIQKSYGVVKEYNDISMLVYGAAFLAVILLFVMWINKINVPLVLNGIVFVLSSIPLLLFSVSEALFNDILRFIIQSILEQSIKINIYALSAIRPIITSMTIVSATVFVLGIIMFIVGIIVGKNKTAPSAESPA